MLAILCLTILIGLVVLTTRRRFDYVPVLSSDVLTVKRPEVDLDNLSFGLFGISLKGIGKAIGGALGIVSKVAKVIPVVGGAVSAAAGAASSVLGGGSSTSTTKAGQTTYTGAVPQAPAPQQSGLLGSLMNKGFLGLPNIVWIGAVAGGVWYFAFRKKGRR